MKWLKWVLILVIAALGIWLMSGKKDIPILTKPKTVDEKDAINIGKKIREKMRKNQNIIRLN